MEASEKKKDYVQINNQKYLEQKSPEYFFYDPKGKNAGQ